MANTADIIQYASVRDITTDVKARVRMLPQGLRTPLEYTVTAVAATGTAADITVTAAYDPSTVNTTTATLTVSATAAAYAAGTILLLGANAVVLSAAAASGATSLTVYRPNFEIAANTILKYNPGALTSGSSMLPVSALPTRIDAGEILDFGGTLVTVTGRSPIGATQLRVQPLSAAITADAEATTKALFAFAGVESAAFPSPELKTVDITNQYSRTGRESIITQQAFTVPVNYQVILDDWGGEQFHGICTKPDLMTRELWFEITSRNGEKHEGVGIPTASPENGGLQDKRMRNATMQVQGDTYIRTAAPFVFY